MATWVTAGFAGWLVLLHLRMIVSPAPQEMREGAVVWLTELLLDGRNPYALAELPAGTNVYGIFYHLVVLPFAWLFGNGFGVHRAVSAASIFGASLLMYRLLRRQRTDRQLATAGALTFYVGSVYFVGALARPDGLGIFLTLASLTVLVERELTARRFAAALLLALLALLTKVYLAYPPFVVAAYIFLFESRRRGLLLGSIAVAAAVGTLGAVTLLCPAYISLSVFANAQDTAYSIRHLLHQSVDWLTFSLPLGIALVLAAGLVVRRGPAPTASPVRPGLFAFASAANAAVFAGWLGGHPGAHMTYLFQLVTPVLLVAVLPLLSTTRWPRAIVSAAVPLSLVINAHYFPLTFEQFERSEAIFSRIAGIVARHPNVLGSTEVAGILALADRPVVDTGQSEYFVHAPVDTPLPGLAPAGSLTARWEAFRRDLNRRIESRSFDLIIRSRRGGLIPRDLVAAHYRAASTLEVYFTWSGQRWPVDLWEPQRQSAAPPAPRPTQPARPHGA